MLKIWPVITPPTFSSWADYLERTTLQERFTRCVAHAKRANRYLPPDALKVSYLTIFDILHQANGRCCYCGSLAVERMPCRPDGGARPWADVGRRIGSLEHRDPMAAVRNAPSNIAWACMWCNTWNNERIIGAEDHGGFYPDEPLIVHTIQVFGASKSE